MSVSVLVVADIRLYRDGLERSLDSMGFATVGTAASADGAVAVLAERPADVALVDMAGTDAAAIAEAISTQAPQTRIVALAVPEQEEPVLACAEAGVSSYVPREASLADLATAIHAAARGEAHCSPAITAFLLQRVRVLGTRPHESEAPELTARQWQILELIGEGLSNKEIAGRLFIEVATVKNHVHNILDRLGVARRSEAAARVRGMRAARRRYQVLP